MSYTSTINCKQGYVVLHKTDGNIPFKAVAHHADGSTQTWRNEIELPIDDINELVESLGGEQIDSL